MLGGKMSSAIYGEWAALAEADAREALQGPVRRQDVEYTAEALDEITRITHRYPYFLQQWGYESWNLAQATPVGIQVIKAATVSATRKLDASFFRVRFDRLTPREKDYLRALAEFGPGPHRSGDVADKLGLKVQSVAPLRGGLIRKGMIYSPAHGDTAFTVPMFDDFMRRIMPDWQPPK